MEQVLSSRVHQLVDFGWELETTTETTTSLSNRRPFNWWLFLIVVFLFPLIGGVLYLVFWWATSKATVFLHVEDGEVATAGDVWLIRLHEAQSAAAREKEAQIKERGFLAVMWPQLLLSLVLLFGWAIFIRWYF